MVFKECGYGHRPLFLRHWKSTLIEIAGTAPVNRGCGASAKMLELGRKDARNIKYSEMKQVRINRGKLMAALLRIVINCSIFTEKQGGKDGLFTG